MCKPCANENRRAYSRTEAGKACNLRNTRRWHARVKSAGDLWRAVRSDPDRIDALRKALVAAPPTLAGEDALLAYWRGYLAGARRGEEESERFRRYQDIAYRVAAELDAKQRRIDPTNRLSYEDMVSVGYEAALEVLRRQKEPARAVVAQAIRRRIVDEVRRRFGATSRAGGKVRLITGALEGEDGPTRILESLEARGEAEEVGDLWERVQGLVAMASGIDERLETILQGRMEGKTLLEISREIGLTESRVCQILKEARPWLEEHVLPLAESA